MAERPTDEELRAELEALVLQQQLVDGVQQITATLAKLLELARLQQNRLDHLEQQVAALWRVDEVRHG